MLYLAQDITVNGAWVAVAGAVLGIVLGIIKLLDRLYLAPMQTKKELSNGEGRTHGGPGCRYDHQLLMKSEERLERVVGEMARGQTALLNAVTAMTKEGEHLREVEKMRHQQVMKSLELIERKISLTGNST